MVSMFDIKYGSYTLSTSSDFSTTSRAFTWFANKTPFRSCIESFVICSGVNNISDSSEGGGSLGGDRGGTELGRGGGGGVGRAC